MARGANRHNRDSIQARRATVAKMYCQGVPQHRIANHVGVTQQQVSSDLKAIRSEWQRTMVEEYDRLRLEQLAKIDAVEAEAWRGWRRSLKDAQKRSEKTGEGASTTVTTEGQAGDPRFLQMVDTCIDRRLRLIGGYPKEEGAVAAAVVVVERFGPGLSPLDLLGGRFRADGQAGPATGN